MNKKFASLVLALFSGATLCSVAQTVDLSPVPQSVEWGSRAFSNQTAFRIKGGFNADYDAVELLKRKVNTKNGEVKIIIGERGDKSVKAYADRIPDRAEGYYLSISPRQVIIAGNDGRGTFYGVQTFLQILRQPEVMSVVVKDYPTMPDRGIIEGFYGNPFSHKNRLDLFDFMGANKMNVFVYGPKDDPYHRDKWRDPYPADEAARMTELVKAAHKNHVQFVWAVHPGVDIRWNKADSINILRKCESVYEMGVRAFCVFFDDIGGEGTKAEKQAALLNYLNKEFVKKHKDVAPLMMCPTQYNKGWSHGSYLNTLGTQMDPSVRIMWTGNTVVDMIERNDMEWINNQISRKAYIWLNYPVTDYCIDHLLMGKTYGNGLDIGNMVSGFCSNPMEYCEASKVSFYSIADYAWNPVKYDAAKSWEMSLNYLMPNEEEAFRVFCENNVDLGPTGHGLRREGESPRFRSALKASTDGLGNKALREVFNEMRVSAEVLQKTTDAPEMMEEIAPWVEATRLTALRGEAVLKMDDALGVGTPEVFIDAYLAYADANGKQRELRSRDFPGSIKVASPVVATNYVEPWMRTMVASLIDQYKEKYDYRLDVFPKQLIPQGKYFIKVDGAYLTDPDSKQGGIAAELRADRDTINPQSQEWTFTLDPNTNRYKIVNNQAGRYINELGKFGTNPYNEMWNTYEITLQDGKYAIRNGGNAGNRFWGVKDGKIYQVSTPQPEAGAFRFEIVPVGGM